MEEQDWDKPSPDEIKELYAFVAEQVIAGLFKSDIIDRLIEMGVARQAAFEVLEEMERRLSNLRKRYVAVVMASGQDREGIVREFALSGYAVWACGSITELRERIADRVPDLIIADAFDHQVKGRDVLWMLRADIIGRAVPVFVLSEQGFREEAFTLWKDVRVLMKPCPADSLTALARELFLKKFKGGA